MPEQIRADCCDLCVKVDGKPACPRSIRRCEAVDKCADCASCSDFRAGSSMVFRSALDIALEGRR